MAEVLVDGVRYLPMKRKTTRHQRPLYELMIDARKVKRESLEEASRRIGTTKTYLWELEQGTSQPTLGVLQRILGYYGIHFDEIAAVTQIRRGDSRIRTLKEGYRQLGGMRHE